MNEVSRTSSSGMAVSVSDDFQSEQAAPKAQQPIAGKGLSYAQIARLLNVTEHELRAYEESQAKGEVAPSELPPAALIAQQQEPDAQLASSSEPEPEPVLEPAFAPWTGGKPTSVQALVDFFASRGIGIGLNDAAHFLHGMVGVNEDLRNFEAILNAPNPFEANNQALGFMFKDRQFIHSAAQASTSIAGAQVQAGQLLTDGKQLYAQTATEGQWVAMRLPKGGMQSGGLARFGVSDEDATALMNNPALTEKIKTLLAPYLGTGYKAEEGAKYVVQRPDHFDLSTFLASGGAVG